MKVEKFIIDEYDPIRYNKYRIYFLFLVVSGGSGWILIDACNHRENITI